MRKGTTPTGFEYEFDESVADDMRLVDAIAVTMAEDSSGFDSLAAASRAAELLLGKAQKKALYVHIGKAHGGRVPIAELTDELQAIMAGEDAVKNS